MWFDKQNPRTTFVDRRPEVNPTIVADTKALPPEVGSGFDLVVFDPPHENCGTGNMARLYGRSTRADILATIDGTAREAWRVTRPGALMAFKWNDCAWALETILPRLNGWEPLFGHGMRLPGRHKTQTYWVMLRRRDMPPLPEVAS